MLTGAIAHSLLDMWEIWCDKLTRMESLPGGPATEEEKSLYGRALLFFSLLNMARLQ